MNGIASGLIDTRLSQPPKKVGKAKIGNVVLGFSEKGKEEIMNLTPLLRIGTVQEAAGRILFPASNLSNHITVQLIRVCGGL